MIYITGDTHSDVSRFSTTEFPEQMLMSKNDYVIVCGDFGLVWNGSKRENYLLDWLENKPFTTLFVSGNHENFDMLKTYPVEEWHGGKVQFIRPSIIHLMRGQVFEDVGGKRIFAMGGAASHDIKDGILDPNDPEFHEKRKYLDRIYAMYRVLGVSWWPEEMPSEEEYAEAEKNLNACGRSVDLIVTHCAPSSIVDVIGSGFYQHDKLTDYFEQLKNNCDYKDWFFGHYHENRPIGRKFFMLYEKIIKLD